MKKIFSKVNDLIVYLSVALLSGILFAVVGYGCGGGDDEEYLSEINLDGGTGSGNSEVVDGGEKCGQISGDSVIYRCDEKNDYLCFASTQESNEGICTHVCNLDKPLCAENEVCLDTGLELSLCSETGWEEGSTDAKNCVNYVNAGLCSPVTKVGNGESCGMPESCADVGSCKTEEIRVCNSDDLICVSDSDEEESSEGQGVCRVKCYPESDTQASISELCDDDEWCVPLVKSEAGACVPIPDEYKQYAGRLEECTEKYCDPDQNLICVSTASGTKKKAYCLEICTIDGDSCKENDQCTCRENEICHTFTGTNSDGNEVDGAACVPIGEGWNDGGMTDADWLDIGDSDYLDIGKDDATEGNEDAGETED